MEHDLPEEVQFLERFDRFSAAVQEIVEMPDRDIERLGVFLAQGSGHLSQRSGENEFRAPALEPNELEDLNLADWLGGRDSNPDTVVQRRRR